MDKLYKIEDIIILNSTNQNEVQALKDSTYSDNVKTRITNYINVAYCNTQIDYDERFYILSETESIDLSLNPRPQKNNAKFQPPDVRKYLLKLVWLVIWQRGKV
jgi:hypothetical protein